MSSVQANQTVERVLVIDDHPLFCDALSMTLTEAGITDDVSKQNCLGDALTLVGSGYKPDVVLLDLNLPDVDGADGVMRLKAAMPDVPVIVVSSMNDARIIQLVMDAGASGYVLKDSPRAVILKAFETVLDGSTCTPEGFVAQTQNGRRSDGKTVIERIASLTPAQRRILASICDGKLNKQIAYDMDIAESTVKAHVTAIFRKLGVQNRTQAVLVASEINFSSVLNQDQQVG
ncbi:MAG: response regulator transcription factor [Gammaproteobacteria bacterium]|nr:response regulator transcription factor [Gammaproteobacteria bacterium]